VSISLEDVLKQVQNLPPLPPLPTSVLQVITLTKDPETSVKELRTVIEQDPVLAASILRQANSSYYGFARRIATLQEAIVVLGFQVIQSLAMSAAVAPLLKTKLLGYEIEQEGLWKHSLLTAIAAKRLCKHRKLPFGDVAFTAGLLHDIGKLITSIYIQKFGSHLLKEVTESKLSYAECEEKVIGFDHTRVGGFIARSWNLPDDLVAAISFHHSLNSPQEYAELSSVIHLANGIASLLGIGGGVDSAFNPIQQEAIDLLAIKESDIELLMTGLDELCKDPTIY